MELRVLSGKAKKVKLKVPRDTRPLSSIAKSSLFSIIQKDLENTIILDLYAGSGALGIEALSRGAIEVDFVEIDKAACNIIRENLVRTKFDNYAIVNPIPAEIFLRYNKNVDLRYDFIFIFQPYDKTNENIISKSMHLLKDTGMIIFERDSTREEKNITGLEIVNIKKYGKTAMTFYKKKLAE
jgi:16S rRNA (guanine(966)-N(2))-methyltransferase RsmD